MSKSKYQMEDLGRFYISQIVGPFLSLPLRVDFIETVPTHIDLSEYTTTPVVDGPVINGCAKRILHLALGF
jgi:hypothetical protein